MEREADHEMLAYFMSNYAPFGVAGLTTGTPGCRCDFCNAKDVTLVNCRSQKAGKSVFACFLCGAAPYLVGVEEVNKMLFKMCVEDGSLNTKRQKSKAKRDAEEIGGLAVPETPSMPESTGDQEATQIFRRASLYLDNGFGQSWRVVPSILSQGRSKAHLTQKQLEVLKKFNESCKSEEQKFRNKF